MGDRKAQKAANKAVRAAGGRRLLLGPRGNRTTTTFSGTKAVKKAKTAEEKGKKKG